VSAEGVSNPNKSAVADRRYNLHTYFCRIFFQEAPTVIRKIKSWFLNSLLKARDLLKANRLQREKCSISHPTCRHIFLAAGVLSLSVWLFMATAEWCTPLHAWLHGGTIPDNDEGCAVIAIAHGKVETVGGPAPAIVPVMGIEIGPRLQFSMVCPARAVLPDGRGPPVSLLPA
jgi:hypothetical protein